MSDQWQRKAQDRRLTEPIPVKDLSKAIVTAVLGELQVRGGFDHWWDEIDDEVKREIKRDLAAAVAKKLS